MQSTQLKMPAYLVAIALPLLLLLDTSWAVGKEDKSAMMEEFSPQLLGLGGFGENQDLPGLENGDFGGPVGFPKTMMLRRKKAMASLFGLATKGPKHKTEAQLTWPPARNSFISLRGKRDYLKKYFCNLPVERA